MTIGDRVAYTGNHRTLHGLGGTITRVDERVCHVTLDSNNMIITNSSSLILIDEIEKRKMNHMKSGSRVKYIGDVVGYVGTYGTLIEYYDGICAVEFDGIGVRFVIESCLEPVPMLKSEYELEEKIISRIIPILMDAKIDDKHLVIGKIVHAIYAKEENE